MCLYPRLIRNPKYKPNKKNKGNPPQAKDKRVLYVPVGCGECIECRRQKANEWKIRLTEELRNTKGYFVTLTFSENSLNDLFEKTAEANWVEVPSDNDIATYAVRHFLERWRKKFKKSVKHWLITELGHNETERLHLHGIIFSDKEKITQLEKIWGYGWTDVGKYCNERTINYIVKYVTKIDNDHKDFKSKILCSAGLGKNYFYREPYFNVFKGEKTREYYKSKEGFKISLPIYYRNNIWNDDEREILWINRMNQLETWILGVKYEMKTQKDFIIIEKALKEAQKTNKKNGYGGDENWKASEYIEDIININKIQWNI